ncbi:MAG: rhomboid family intramembrane serine protease [Candidatus Bathyarchaeota archaeon]|nr:MAG: rhomboid family intramembrane serine protease [Candidatus Bathyarchaeota archaeon]
MLEHLAFSGENLQRGKVWTLLTGLFLHGDPLHLLGNMIFLYVFGNTLEDILNAEKTLSAFFLGGVLSFLVSAFIYDPEVLMIGASAAIFTLAAIAMLVRPLKFSFFFLMPIGLAAIIYFIYNLAAVYYGYQGNIAYISHVIGFVIGVPLGIGWSRKWVENLLITLAMLFIYLLLGLFMFPALLQLL